jgi:hypothetical protein
MNLPRKSKTYGESDENCYREPLHAFECTRGKIGAFVGMSRVAVVIIFRPIIKPLCIQQFTHPSINKSASTFTLPQYVSSSEARPVQPRKLPQGSIGPLAMQKEDETLTLVINA